MLGQKGLAGGNVFNCSAPSTATPTIDRSSAYSYYSGFVVSTFVGITLMAVVVQFWSWKSIRLLNKSKAFPWCLVNSKRTVEDQHKWVEMEKNITPNRGIEPRPPRWKRGILTTGPIRMPAIIVLVKLLSCTLEKLPQSNAALMNNK